MPIEDLPDPIDGFGAHAVRGWIKFLHVTHGDGIVKYQHTHESDIAQARVFAKMLTAQRAELCDQLDAQSIKLARYDRRRDAPAARRKRLRIKEIGAELRDIDRMLRALGVALSDHAEPRHLPE